MQCGRNAFQFNEYAEHLSLSKDHIEAEKFSRVCIDGMNVKAFMQISIIQT